MFTMVNNFVDWLETELLVRQLTRHELARRMNMSPSTLSLIWSGQRKPGVEVCKAIADALMFTDEFVFRKAGLLSPKTTDNPRFVEIAVLMEKLSEQDQMELVQIARLKVERLKSNQP
jgi:transcriptional regulator with XRE-family HTH domain